MTGLYLPYWMADYDATVDFQAQAVVRRVWVSGNTEFTEHKDFVVERHGNIEVDNIHELAHGKIDRTLIESIAPFDEAQATDFNLSYLSGFWPKSLTLSATRSNRCWKAGPGLCLFPAARVDQRLQRSS